MKRILFGLLLLSLSACEKYNPAGSTSKPADQPPAADAVIEEKTELTPPDRYRIGDQAVNKAVLIEALNRSLAEANAGALRLQRISIAVQTWTENREWQFGGASTEIQVDKSACDSTFTYTQNQNDGLLLNLMSEVSPVVPFWVPQENSQQKVVFAELPAAGEKARKLLDYEGGSPKGGAALTQLLENSPNGEINEDDVFFHLSKQLTPSLPSMEFSILIRREAGQFIVIDLSYAPTTAMVRADSANCD